LARIVDRMDGLALLGSGSFGPLALPVPGLLWSRGRLPSNAPIRPISVDAGEAVEPPRRSLRLQEGELALSLELAIPTPEISGQSGAAAPVADRIWSVHLPLSPEDWRRVREARPDLVIWGNSRALWNSGEPWILALRELRTQLGGRTLLWAPRTALPHRIALLSYLSVDVFDTTEGLWQAGEGTFLDPTLGTFPAADARAEARCTCPGCRSSTPDLGQHAVEAFASELGSVRSAIRAGRLREMVELRQAAEPALAEMLRYADRHLGPLLEERTPVLGAGVRTYILRESLRRPEVRRYRDRFGSRYAPPPSKPVLLLVPCSRTKPYRNSRSHRRIAGALEGLSPLERVHWVSVTSPLGLVPRELEDLPPSRHYDIPVTGEWDATEAGMVRDALRRLLERGSYERVVIHLDPVEYTFLKSELPAHLPTTWTMTDDRATSPESLAALRVAAAEALEGIGPRPGGPLAGVREELRALAAMQFGPEAADALFADPVRLQGRPWFQRLTDQKGHDLATWQETRGLFQLTMKGGERLWPLHPLEVEVDPAIDLKGDLFSPGVRGANPAIRVGDAVLLAQAGRLAGVGEAILPGPLMSDLTRGLAVHVRHHARADRPAETAPAFS
jgi:archaeosine synthase alpha-subunit